MNIKINNIIKMTCLKYWVVTPSYTWRSIWSTVSLLRLGYRCINWDWKSINVWSDLWIRTRNNMKPTTPPPYHFSNLTVSQLFDHQENTWDLTLWNSIMNTQHVSDICKVPLYSIALSDSIVWTSTVTPIFNYLIIWIIWGV